MEHIPYATKLKTICVCVYIYISLVFLHNQTAKPVHLDHKIQYMK